MTTTILRAAGVLALAGTLVFYPFLFVPRVRASTANWTVKAVSVIPSDPNTFASGDFQQSVRNFQADGGNYVNFIVPLYQSNPYSTDINAGYNTPTDSALASGIQFVHSLGMRAQISIYLENYSGEWRAIINPGDRNTWYQRYGDELVHYGQIAQQQGVELYELGAELIMMSSGAANPDNTERWDGMISRVRAVYSGALTYSANRGQNNWASELPNIGFWDKLDYIGVSAYYDFATDDSVSSLEGGWQNVNNYDITPVEKRWGKPILFTEVGYRSVTGAHQHPWDSGMSGPYDAQEQVNDYQALLDYWNNYSFMQGVDLWWWSPNPNYGGSGNTDYTPQHKPAEQTLKSWWAGGGTPPPQPTGTPRFGTKGSVSNSTPPAGQPVTLTASVIDSGDPASNVVVDLEVYSGGSKVFQQYMGNQSFAANETKQFTASWTPSSAGQYTFKIGVFAGDWSKNYTWNDNVATIQAGGSAPSGSTITDVWWPTDGAHVSGIQPFKIMLENTDVSQYDSFWQVDGGGLVPLYTSTQSWPHKEALVDLSGWHWKGSGPYTITFVSKDKSGNTISTKSVQLWTQ